MEQFTRTFQADAYAGFHHRYDSGRVSGAACWAHARLKFHEIHVTHPSPVTTEAIERIAALYAIEKEIRGSTPELRNDVRQTRAAPLLSSLHGWLENTSAKLSKKSDTAAAIRYALSRWRPERVALARQLGPLGKLTPILVQG